MDKSVDCVHCGSQVLCSMSWTGYWKLCVVLKVRLILTGMHQVGAKNHMGSAHFRLTSDGINDVLVVRVD